MVLNVKTSNSSYDVIIEKGVLNKASKYLNLNRKVLIVTDNNIPESYIETIIKQSKQAYLYKIKAGEISKNFDNFQSILSFMLEHNFSRNDVVVALGGGVVGDLAVFVASTYMRGIDFYNIPTTLLSQVDSSIGGKTAIDFKGFKNIVGSFYPPMCVLIDPNTLSTLDVRQLHSGLVESIKMALTCDASLFKLIENSDDLMNDIEKIIYKSLLIKKNVVEQDEKESNIRRVLNFGHTLGHAIESYSQYNLLHGECVGLGMLFFIDEKLKNRLISLLKKYDLPYKCDYEIDKLLPLLSKDKKTEGNEINIVKVKEIGSYKLIKVNLKDIKKEMIL